MKYIIIGLGNYGSVLAEELTELGHEVIGVDSDALRVEQLKDKVTTSFVMDATDEQAIAVLPLHTVDVVIVTVGENFGASVRVVALLKKNKVKHIYARAVDDIHKSILEAFELDKILTPEQEAARSLVRRLELNAFVESFRIDTEHYIFKFGIPSKLVGVKLNELKLEQSFGITVISLIKGKTVINNLGLSILKCQVPDTFDLEMELAADDKLVCYGLYKDFVRFWKSL